MFFPYKNRKYVQKQLKILVGIKGFVDVNNKTVNLIASKITWLSQ